MGDYSLGIGAKNQLQVAAHEHRKITLAASDAGLRRINRHPRTLTGAQASPYREGQTKHQSDQRHTNADQTLLAFANQLCTAARYEVSTTTTSGKTEEARKLTICCSPSTPTPR